MGQEPLYVLALAIPADQSIHRERPAARRATISVGNKQADSPAK
jgi:hypothetical protein